MAKKKDAGHEETDKLLEKLEKRIAREYAQAEGELESKLADYMDRFAKKDALKRKALAEGLITEKEYKQWKIGQLAIGARWAEMKDTIAEDLSNASKIAASIAGAYMAEVYAINHNYGTFQVEKAALVDTSYTLYDRHTVERLFKDDNTFYHTHGKRVGQHIAEGKLESWNKQQAQSVMIQSILQGESVGSIASRLQETMGDSVLAEDIKNANKMTAEQIAKELVRRNRNASIRNARTMATGVECAGRVDAYKRAEDMGIQLQQEWLATLDGRTRHEHRILDGQRVDVGDKFEVEGYEIAFPGDPTADAEMVYNCRCTLTCALKGHSLDYTNTDIRHNKNMKEETYEEWKNSHDIHSDPIDKQDKIAKKMKGIYGAEYRKYKNSGKK